MEFANEGPAGALEGLRGLRETSASGGEAEVLGAAPAERPPALVVEEDEPPGGLGGGDNANGGGGGCVCGECVRCKLRQMRDDVAHQERATAWGTPDDARVTYAEAAARQLEAQIEVLSGKIGRDSHARSVEESPSPVSVGGASGASVRSSAAESGAVPDWLADMIQDPEAAGGGVSEAERGASPERRRNNVSRGTHQKKTGAGGGGVKPAGARQQRPWGAAGSTAAKRSHSSEAEKRPAARMPRAIRVKPQAKPKSPAPAKMSMDQIFAIEMAKVQQSQQSQQGGHVAAGGSLLSEDLRMSPSSAGSASPRRGARATATELGFADDSLAGSLGPPSPGSPRVWHPRPWSPPATGRSLHSAPKPMEGVREDNPRDRRQKVNAAVPGQQKRPARKQGATINRHARTDAVGLLDQRAERPAVASSAGGRPSAGGSNAGDGLSEDFVRELQRLRIDNESLYRQLQASESEKADQKATFRSQLARVRQRSKVLEEQVIALTAEKRRGWAPAPALLATGSTGASSSGLSPPRAGGRNVGFEIPSRPR